MDAQRSDFLNSMIEILDRLHETCVSRGEPLLASVLAIAKGEAEDALRHADELMALNAMREKMSSTTSWRAEDQRALGLSDIGEGGAVAEAARDEVERYAADDVYAADADIADDYQADEDEIAA